MKKIMATISAIALSVSLLAPAAFASGDSGCERAEGVQHSTTLLGGDFLKMKTSFDFCWENGEISSIDNVNTTFDDVAVTASIGDEKTHLIDGIGTPEGHVRIMYEVTNAAAGVDIMTINPYNDFKVYPGGDYSHTSGE
ncbi:MAG: hypothetical protein Q3976_08565 [Corynebacterium sp.]|nr:hypothetical protein [Corynebacterium sp.]